MDGGFGEGGGALVRTAFAMAAVTQQPVRIVNVRAGTKRPGLAPEEIAVARALAHACQGKLAGCEPGSHDVTFLPEGQLVGTNLRITVPEAADGPGTANAMVILSTLAPVMCRTGVFTKLVAEGETHGAHVLSYDYFAHVTVGAWRRLGLYTYPDLLGAGFGRSSKGEAALEVEPSVLRGTDLSSRGELKSIHALITTAGLSDSIAQRGVGHLSRLAFYANQTVEVDVVEAKSATPGACVTIWAEYERAVAGFTSIGAKGVRIESVVQAAFDGLVEWMPLEATVDSFLADQILLTACLAEGETVFVTPALSQRLSTMAWVVKQFLPIHLTIRGQLGRPAWVSIRR